MIAQRSVLLLAVAGSVGLAACATASDSTDAPTTLPVVVDTDMGFDDVRALMVLARSPAVDLLAVTVAGNGLARCPAGAVNAAALLDELGRPDVPVACGSRSPIEGSNLAPTAWRDDADALAGMDLPTGAVDEAIADADGVELLVTTLVGASRPVTVLTLGPLTNLALALDTEPDLADHVDRVVVMGGAVEVGGNTLGFQTPATAEFNIWFDPVAAQRVVDSGLPVTLVPLDATNALPITAASYERLGRGADGAAAAMLRGYVAENPFRGGIYHWDDLAAASLIDPMVIETTDLELSIESAGVEAGRTVVDPDGAAVTVATDADRTRFGDAVAATLGDVSRPPDESIATVVYDGEVCEYDGPDPLPPTLDVEIVNSSSISALGVVAGSYAEGTTQAEVDAYADSNPTGPPPYLTLTGIAPLPAHAVSYWRFRNSPDTSLQCVFTMTTGVHLAGPEPD